MTGQIKAQASPEKRLFISLLTRDISMVAAVLDLIDNSINAVIEPHSTTLSSAADYLRVMNDPKIKPARQIRVSFSDDIIAIEDNAPGISSETAENHVFKFGRSHEEENETDRLSVYGIGMKRAIFKLGNKINIVSDHGTGGFALDLDVDKWSKLSKLPWTIDIVQRLPAAPEKCGTKIVISDLYEDTKKRINDGVFIGQMKAAISKTYAYFLAKFVEIYVNDEKIDAEIVSIGDNHSFEMFNEDGVSCAISAGIGVPDGDKYRERSSGWFVFCNGRAVISADKSTLTGWGADMPVFQPKHRPFLGTVFFVSTNAEKLPWTTTKAGINEDSGLWQAARRKMISVGSAVLKFLDQRYTEDGTDISTKDVTKAAGKQINLFSAAANGGVRTFTTPTKPKPQEIKIQYFARVADISAIASYLGNKSMGAAEVGRHTFNFFLKNEVGEN